MGAVQPPKPVKLFLGIITGFPEILRTLQPLLIERLGPVDHESPWIPFEFTDYYRDTMGRDLQRKFLSFERLIMPGTIASIKIETNGLEEYYAGLKTVPVPRPINLDPGLLTLSKVILPTTKDFSHRLYMSDGIHLEITLTYKDNAYAPGPWTFPDYQTQPYLDFFHQVRRLYHERLKM